MLAQFAAIQPNQLGFAWSARDGQGPSLKWTRASVNAEVRGSEAAESVTRRVTEVRNRRDANVRRRRCEEVAPRGPSPSRKRLSHSAREMGLHRLEIEFPPAHVLIGRLAVRNAGNVLNVTNVFRRRSGVNSRAHSSSSDRRRRIPWCATTGRCVDWDRARDCGRQCSGPRPNMSRRLSSDALALAPVMALRPTPLEPSPYSARGPRRQFADEFKMAAYCRASRFSRASLP